MMAIADDVAMANRLATLGRLDEAGLDRRLARFRDRLRDLREDPAEAARIDALVADAEREDQDPGTGPGNGLTIHVNGGVVHLSHGDGRTGAVSKDAEERIAALELELTRLRSDLEAVRNEARSRSRPRRAETLPGEEAPSRPRRTWEAVLLTPAFGNGALVAILAAATVTTALHAAPLALTVIASVLAATTAAAAFLSAWMPLTSVRQLNRQGQPAVALELLSRQGGTHRLPDKARDEEGAAPEITRPPSTSPPPASFLQRYQRYPGFQEDASRPRVCPNCGSEAPGDNSYCDRCGVSLHVVRESY